MRTRSMRHDWLVRQASYLFLSSSSRGSSGVEGLRACGVDQGYQSQQRLRICRTGLPGVSPFTQTGFCAYGPSTSPVAIEYLALLLLLASTLYVTLWYLIFLKDARPGFGGKLVYTGWVLKKHFRIAFLGLSTLARTSKIVRFRDRERLYRERLYRERLYLTTNY